MYQRDIQIEFERALADYPIVTLLGPRQAGKTTLVRNELPDWPYYNLEKPDIRELVVHDPVAILKKHSNGIIFDEIQRLPSLLSYLQAEVDEKRKNGLYVITGSHQSELHAAVSQSLAGRTSILHLLPLSMRECMHNQISQSLDEYLLKGFLPRIYQQEIDPNAYYRNYVETYVEKDVRQLINIKDLLTFQRFLKLCASRVGQVLNMHGLGKELGVSNHTVKHWLSILQASYVVYLLPPYFENFGKRVIKSPKLYFFDVGLLAFLLDIELPTQLEHALRGNLVENLVVMELYKTRYNHGSNPNLYYYRDSQQHEIDLVYKHGNHLVPIEIKAGKTIHRSFFRGLEYFRKLIGKRFDKGYLVYTGDVTTPYGEFSVISYEDVAEVVGRGSDKFCF